MITKQEIDKLKDGVEKELSNPFIPNIIKKIDIAIFNQIVKNYEKKMGVKYLEIENN